MRPTAPLLPAWLALTLLGCATPLPGLSLQARLSLRDGGRSQHASVGAAMLWRGRRTTGPGRQPPPEPPEPRAVAARRPCRRSPLCAWQTRAVRRALLSLHSLHSLREEDLPWTD
jgi:hypothetical protein